MFVKKKQIYISSCTGT